MTTPPPPGGPGGFDVRPPHVYHASGLVKEAQFAHAERAFVLVDVLNKYNQSAGTGHGADAFADAYMKVTEKFLEAWGRSVVSVGGAAVGLTLTANHYVMADWEAGGRKGSQPASEPEPVVINKPPRYGPVNTVKWSGTGEDVDSWWISGAIGEVPDFLADAIRPGIEHGLRLGKVHEITPGLREDEVRDMATAWRNLAGDVTKAGDELTAAISSITDPKGNGEWQGAMKAFCQSIWGTTEWGRPLGEDGKRNPAGRSWRTDRNQNGPKRPILDVLKKTADAMPGILEHLADVGDRTTETTSRLGAEAAKAMVKELTLDIDFGKLTRLAVGGIVAQVVLSFRSHMDKAGMDAAVENYHREFHAAAVTLNNLLPELEEAILSAPTYQAETARAQGFGARALNEFKREHKWQRAGESPSLYMYSFDLAMNEELSGGHTLDKHVGKTDEQLLQRHRDEAKGSGKLQLLATSSFTDIDSAQKYTQYCIRQNTAEIQDWLKNPPPQPASKSFQVDSVPVEGPLTGNAVTGRTSQRLDDHTPAPVKNAYGVSTRLKYDPNLDPPFVVLTSAPE
ncbi:hypothetical protein J7E93_21440 [Streptomyces sp. ISL-36]|uniref:RNase A-like domain-containing protein n=1 Tax=Streptomyces sp. ISL-36 TaxID=2819182 RepID=UPI001BEAD99D|nr:RNase A-like domain-containing protein [Streptomyces sp. ISL-36]MBT2442624.1 hypothetical protein [Streptomyces sp. ISL-36]